ncbi:MULTISPECIES: YqgE/AlgH family protein [Limnobacter]|uniref:UPF0301 protein GCM10007875_00500 n=1 Tax=Limnobacter litoralis TaxID=481366 RepID=A0ABQ5YKA4_9BURK|nr:MULTISPECIES: YqgE/AlgH family protein [Limnobacter]GLR24963.1 UPF0301 protein [Limnobacter litoralis]HEX5487431.1 YqgE/AlgH family protein [Limnobacter sp.]
MKSDSVSDSKEFSLSGQFLIAMPNMLDPNFAGSLVYLCEHSSKGAMGLIVNKPTDMGIDELLDRIDLKVTTDMSGCMPVMAGGPVSAERGFVLHTNDRVWNSSLVINDRIALTTSLDILEAVADGKAPQRWLITLGYAGWSEGQLEQELAANAWMTVAADEHILFDMPLPERFAGAYHLLGIDPLMLSGAAGHA